MMVHQSNANLDFAPGFADECGRLLTMLHTDKDSCLSHGFRTRRGLALVLGLCLLGCSKKPEDVPQGEQQKSEAFAPITTGPRSASPKRSVHQADPDYAIAELRAKGDSYNESARHAALKQFRDTIPPTHPRRADAFLALVETVKTTKGPDHKTDLYAMIPGYAVGDDIPVLVELADKDRANLTLYVHTTRRMRELKDPRAAPAAARWYGEREFNKPDPHAGPVLHALGATAIPAMIPYMQVKAMGDVRPWHDSIKLSALSLFHEFGTEECIPVLKLYLDHPNPGTRKRFQEAITAIKQRAAKGKP